MTGSVLAGVLLLVAMVAGVLAGTTGGGVDRFLGEVMAEDLSGSAQAEVLDVDDEFDPTWPTVDVRFTTDDGEVVVTYVDWEWSDEVPEVGDTVEVAYDPLDPEWAFAADDPYVDGAAGGTPSSPADSVVARAAGLVALGALGAVVLVAVLTVVAVATAPARTVAAPPAGPFPVAADPYRPVGPRPAPGPRDRDWASPS